MQKQVKSVKGTTVTIDLDKMVVTTKNFGDIEFSSIHRDIYEGSQVWALPVKVNGKGGVVMFADDQAGKDIANELVSRRERELDQKIPGLSILRKAAESWDAYHESFLSMMEDEMNDGVNPPVKPAEDYDELAEQYPIARAYLKAESFENASNFKKSAAGRKAKGLLIERGDVAEAHRIMDSWISNVYID